MSFQDAMNTMLAPRTKDGVTYTAGITSGYRTSSRPGHNGVDFNYSGVGQSGVNLEHPDVGSPVDGEVVGIVPELGQVQIKDSNGFIHQITHLDSISDTIFEGMTISAGQLLGTMGNTGPGITDQHVDYKIYINGKTGSTGITINPEKYWDCRNADGTLTIPGQDILMLTDGWLTPGFLERYRDMFTVSLNQDLRRGGDPLILDLDGDGVETTGVKDGAWFDHQGDGFKEQTGWVGADDGLLVRDLNGNGRIDNGAELFGDNTLLPDGTTAPNGFEALKALDDNRDGKIDSQDQAFADLRVWKDANGDGYTAAGELMTLGEAGVTALNTRYATSSKMDENQNAHRQVGTYIRSDGATAALVEQFIATESPMDRETLIPDILFRWAGVDGLDPFGRGTAIGDARKVCALEKFFGEDFVQINQNRNPGTGASIFLNRAFEGIGQYVMGQLDAQTRLKPLFEKITWSWNETTQQINGSLALVADHFREALLADRGAAMARLTEFVRSLKGIFDVSVLDGSPLAALGTDVAGLMDQNWSVVLGGPGNDVIFGTDVIAFGPGIGLSDFNLARKQATCC